VGEVAMAKRGQRPAANGHRRTMEMERNQEPGADVFQIEVAAAAAAQGYSPRGFPSFSCSPHPTYLCSPL